MRATIIPAETTDAPEILALQRLAYQSEARLYDDWSIPPLTQTLSGLEAEFGRMTILKALGEAGAPGLRLLGSVRAELCGGVCNIGRLMVHPEARRQGLGTALLRAVESCFPSARCFALFTGAKSLANLDFYMHAGFHELRRQVESPKLTLVFLEKPGPAAR